jgi:hypothetical protein
MLSIHNYIYRVYVKLYYYMPALLSYLWFFFIFLLTMSISYFGLHVRLLRIVDVNEFNSKLALCTPWRQTDAAQYHSTHYLPWHYRVTVHNQAPTTLTLRTHHLGSCEHSRANLEAFKRGTNFYQITIPYIFSP